MCNINEVVDCVSAYVFVFHICDDGNANFITFLLDFNRNVIECMLFDYIWVSLCCLIPLNCSVLVVSCACSSCNLAICMKYQNVVMDK